MFASLGAIVFEPLSGFQSYGETDDAVIAQYDLIEGKPRPVFSAPGLRKLQVGLRLRQEFIIVKAARIQLRAYKDQGEVLTLTWGNGDVEGQWLIANLSMQAEQMDGLGNIIGCTVDVELVEVPDGLLLVSKQGSSWKEAVANKPKDYPEVVFVRPEPQKKSNLKKFLEILRRVVRLAGQVDALAYGGGFPNLGSSLTSVLANARYNLILLQTNYTNYGSDYAMPDMSGVIGGAISALEALAVINPVVDAAGFLAANRLWQVTVRALAF